MTEMTTREVLQGALEVISGKDAWCIDYMARNKRGSVVDVMSLNAVQFCAIGAVYRAAGTMNYTKPVDYACHALDKAVETLTGRPMHHNAFIDYNNGHTQEDVILMFKTALADLDD